MNTKYYIKSLVNHEDGYRWAVFQKDRELPLYLADTYRDARYVLIDYRQSEPSLDAPQPDDDDEYTHCNCEVCCSPPR